MSGRIDFTMGFNTPGAQRKSNPDSSYRIYILGDFSGRRETPWLQRKIQKIDRDNFEQILAKIAPQIAVDAGGVALSFTALEDFHPDVWLKKVSIIAELLGLKRQLQNPDTAAQAASNIQAFLPGAVGSDLATPPQAIQENQEDMLQRLLGKTPETPAAETTSIDRWLKELVAPHVAQDAGPQYQPLIQLIDVTVTQLLRSILHSSVFQSREALWLVTHALLNEEATERHDCYLLDIAQDELTAAIGSGATQDFTQKLLHHSQTAEPEQDVLLLGDFSFSASGSDDALLDYCTSLAAACAGQFLAAVDQSFLQRSANAGLCYAENPNLMLTYPRYLVRLPYGDKRDPIESFAFEECQAIPQAGELLWGNPAFLLARAMLRIAADETAAEAQFFGDIPAFSGGPKLQPAVEMVLTEAQANAVLAQGILPLIGYQQRRVFGYWGLAFDAFLVAEPSKQISFDCLQPSR